MLGNLLLVSTLCALTAFYLSGMSVVPHTNTYGRVCPSTSHGSFFFRSAKTDLCVFGREWPVENPKAVVFFVHGFGEYINRYEEFAAYLNKAGLSVFGIDNQGFGKSDGDRAHVEKFNHLVADVYQLVDLVVQHKQPELKGIPRFLFGHSLGGLISIETANQRPIYWTGVIMTAPAIVPDPELASPFLRRIAGIAAQLVPKLPIGNSLRVHKLSKDADLCESVENDPMMYHGRIRANFGNEVLKVLNNLDANMEHIKWPFLIIHGEEDEVCRIEGSEALVRRASTPKDKKSLIRIKDALHEVLHDSNKEKTMEETLKWIQTLL